MVCDSLILDLSERVLLGMIFCFFFLGFWLWQIQVMGFKNAKNGDVRVIFCLTLGVFLESHYYSNILELLRRIQVKLFVLRLWAFLVKWLDWFWGWVVFLS